MKPENFTALPEKLHKHYQQQINNIKDMKKKEIQHFESKVFEIDKVIAKIVNKHKKLIKTFDQHDKQTQKIESEFKQMNNAKHILKKIKWTVALHQRLIKAKESWMETQNLID